MNPLASLDTWQLIALAGALGWASGVRLYLVLFVVGGAGWLGWVDLPSGLQVLAHPWVLAASGFMVAVEFLADKVPGVDSVWDAVHTFIRIPAGAALAASVFGDAHGAGTLAAAILGGSLAAGAHFAKAGTRALLNTSPEPFTNWTASLSEDLVAGTLLWLAFAHPLVAGLAVLLLTVASVWLVSRVWKFLRRLFRGRATPATAATPRTPHELIGEARRHD